ncbi:MAG: hypothetical protein K6E18_04450 [Lachnospiraceae bacterium]|nr:hypothetical protein [Lachnospiraceae bacterium]
MKQKIMTSLGFILAAFWLAACAINGAVPASQAGKLVYGAECVVLRGPDSTYYIIEKPQANDTVDWNGTDPSFRRQWVKVEHGEIAGRILADVLEEQEFLDAKLSIQIPEDGEKPYIVDDLWDDETISEDEVKELGLLEDSKCAEIADLWPAGE